MESVRVEKTVKTAVLTVDVLLDILVTGEGVKDYPPHQAVVLAVPQAVVLVVIAFQGFLVNSQNESCGVECQEPLMLSLGIYFL